MSFATLRLNSIHDLAHPHFNTKFNLIDWSLSDKECFAMCSALPLDKFKEIARDKAFWNAVLNRWGLYKIVEEWNADKLHCIVQVLQTMPDERQQSPRMKKSLEAIFDKLIQLGIPASDKVCACVNALEVHNIGPLVNSFDPTHAEWADTLFAHALQNMQNPCQKEFLTKFVLGSLAFERTLLSLSALQFRIIISQNPMNSILVVLVNNPLFSDVRFKVEDRIFHAHSILLKGCPYLKKTMEASNSKVMELREVSGDGFKMILEYLYTGQINIEVKTAISLLVTSDLFELNELKRNCIKFINANKNEFDSELLSSLEDYMSA